MHSNLHSNMCKFVAFNLFKAISNSNKKGQNNASLIVKGQTFRFPW